MAASKHASKNGRRKTQFTFNAEEAKSVKIVGDFNNWREEGKTLKHNGNGNWQITLMLPPGTYEYKFLVDGSWVNDPLNERLCINCFGTRNNYIDV